MAEKNQEFSKRLRDIVIGEFGWSKKDFAEKSDIHINSATNYLEKGVVPEWDILLRISRLVSKSTDFLLLGDNSKTETPISNRINEVKRTEDEGFSTGSFTTEEQELIKALREIDPVSRKGIYFSAINQLRESMREKEIRRDKRKKEIIENALDVLKKAI